MTEVTAEPRIAPLEPPYERALDAMLKRWMRPGSESSRWRCSTLAVHDECSPLPKVHIPTLVVHGTADRILPFEATAARLQAEALIADLRVIPVQDGPHNIGWTHPDEVMPRCWSCSAAGRPGLGPICFSPLV